jgi:hypothetical protein
MLDALSRMMFGRERVRWALPKVGAALQAKYGAGGFFTAGQMKRAIDEVGIAPDLHPLVYAAACGEDEFLRAMPESTPEEYKALRAELVEILGLTHSNVNMRPFMKRHRAEAGNTEGGEV